MKDDILLGDTPKATRRRHRVRGVNTRGRLWKHSTLADIDGLVPDPVLDRLFAFTLVRNPWDRVVSYYHWLRTQSFDHPSVRLARETDFDGFVTHPRTLQSFRSTPAAHYMRRSGGREQCNAYIRIENFAADVAPLAAHLGFALDLPVVNASERSRDYRGYYNDESAETLGRACAEDIARFGYSFG